MDENHLCETFVPGEEKAFFQAASKDQIEYLKEKGVLVSPDSKPSSGMGVEFASAAASTAFAKLGLKARDMKSFEPSSPKGFTKADVVDAAEQKEGGGK
jgi:hypothetical protein